MKKLIIISLHFVVVFTILIAIGMIPEKEVTGVGDRFTGELERNVTLKILENDTAKSQGYLQELLDAFNEEYKEYGIVAVDANMNEGSDLENDGPYGYGPDVVYQANDKIMGYVDGKHILPIPQALVADNEVVDDKAWSAFNRDGVNYGVPVNIQSSLLYYRKDLIPSDWATNWDDNKNQVPDMIESWPAMYKFSEMLKNDGNPNTFGYMRSFLEPYFSLGYMFSYGAYIFGDNDTNWHDVGLNNGNAYLGLQVIRQQASLMDERCVDDTITVTAYSQLAAGNFFATITTPDVHARFTDEFERKGLDPEKCLGVTTIPMLPASGDLTDEDSELIPNVSMGGVHGYAISSYTKSPNAALAFVNFATNYEMIKTRTELLGIVPARKDIAEEVGGTSSLVNQNLENGEIYIMPSISQLNAVWDTVPTLFIDLAKDPFRTGSDKPKYDTLDKLKAALAKCNQDVINALNTLG